MHVHHSQQQQPGSLVYLVTNTHCSMCGIEALRIITVPPAQQPAFLKAYVGRILLSAASVQELLVQFGQQGGGS